MSTIDPKLMARLAKLKEAVELGKREDSGTFATEHEAQAFASLLQKLLLEHDLSMSDIEYAAKDETIGQIVVDFDKYDTEHKTRPRRVPWMEALAKLLAPAFNCQPVAMYGSSAPIFVGRTSDLQVLEYIYVTLIRTAEDMSGREAKTFRRRMKRTCSICEHGLGWHEARDAVDVRADQIGDTGLEWDCPKHVFKNSLDKAHGFRRSFLNGFIKRLGERLDEERARVLAEAASGGQALMRINNALIKVKEWSKENMDLKKGRGLSNQWHHNEEGDKRGRKIADDVKLKGDAMGSQSSPQQLNPQGRDSQ